MINKRSFHDKTFTYKMFKILQNACTHWPVSELSIVHFNTNNKHFIINKFQKQNEYL